MSLPNKEAQTETHKLTQREQLPPTSRGGLRFPTPLVIVTILMVTTILAHADWQATNPQQLIAQIRPQATTTIPATELRTPEPTPMKKDDFLRSYLQSVKPEGFEFNFQVKRLSEPVQVVGLKGGSNVKVVNNPFGVNDGSREIDLTEGQPIGGKTNVQEYYVELLNPVTGETKKIYVLYSGEADLNSPGGQRPLLAVVYSDGVWTTDLGTEKGIVNGEQVFPETHKLTTTTV